MATERIEIVVTERGSRVVDRRLRTIGNTAKSTGGAMALLKRALLALGGIAIIRGLLRLSDTFTNIQNRLRTVTDSVAELNVVTKELFEISRLTRSSFEGTAEVFARTALAVKDLGISQRETLQFAESLNKAVVLSGAGAQEANNALIQLSQGLASNTLRGDELRSVLEQLPVVADVIAKGLGVTRGELRELGKQGKITAEDILRSFRDAREELDERFKETVPTIGQAFGILRNEFTRLLGEFNKATGASAGVARAIIFVADSLEGLFRSFEDISDIAVSTVEVIMDNFGGLADALGPSFEEFRSLFADVTLRDILLATAAVADSILGIWTAQASAIVAVFEGLPTALKGVFQNVMRAITVTTLNGINGLIAKVNQLPGVDLSNLFIEFDVGEANTAAADFGRNVGSAFEEGFKSSTTFTEFATDVLEKADARKVARQSQRNQDIVDENAARRGLNVAADRVLPEDPEGLKVREQLLREIKGPQEDFIQAQEQLNMLLADGEITVGEYNNAMTNLQLQTLETATTAAEGFRRGFLSIKADILDVAGAASNVLTNAWNSAEDALVQFVTTGEFSFSKFVDGILADLTRLLARQALSGLLNSFAGGGAGGALGSLFSSFGGARADGGPVRAGVTHLVGERGPELFTSSTNGNITSNAALGQMATQPPAVNVQVINVQREEEVPSAMESREGDRVILNSITRNRDALRTQLGIA